MTTMRGTKATSQIGGTNSLSSRNRGHGNYGRMLDPTDLNWYEANGHDIAIRLYEIVSFVPGGCFILVVLLRLHFTAPCGAASLDLSVGCSRLARGAGLSLALKCFTSTGRREYPSCIYFVVAVHHFPPLIDTTEKL